MKFADTMELELELSHPPEKVWRAATDPALLGEWLLPVTGFAPEPGTEFTFQAEPQPDWDGVVRCRMLEVEPGRTLRWSWVVGDIDTVVTLTLEPTPTGTLLTVEQTGFREDQKRNLGGARYGWKMMGGRLEALLETIH